MSDPAPYAARACVVISNGLVAEHEIRRRLGNVLPLHIVEWQRRTYLHAIQTLQPQVIIVMAESDQVAADSALLMAALLDDAHPTIASLVMDRTDTHPSELMVWQLGLGAGANITSLLDLRLA